MNGSKMSRKSHCAISSVKRVGVIQLFHELKQRYPNIPDPIIRNCIKSSCCDFHKCCQQLEYEQNYLPRALIYPKCLMKGFVDDSITDSSFLSDCKTTNSNSSDNKVSSKTINIYLKINIVFDFDTSKKLLKNPEIKIDQNSNSKTTVNFQIRNPHEQLIHKEVKMLIDFQIEKKELLLIELRIEEHQLNCAKKQIAIIEKAKAKSDGIVMCKKYLIDNIKDLQNICERLTLEIDKFNKVTNNQTEFKRFDNIKNENSWVCSICTFQNHPLLDKCEQCEMPKIS